MIERTIIYPVKHKKRYLKVKPMTINIGIKCSDGIVVASDSQIGFWRGVDVKRVNANKIYNWDNRFALSGSGILAQIQTVVDNVKASIAQREKDQRCQLTKDECEDTIERIMWALYARYNIQRSQAIGADEREHFSPECVFAVRSTEDGNNILCLYIVHADGTLEPEGDYATSGSGAAYAEILLKNFYSDKLKVQEAIKIAAYVINEVKEMDPSCGGPTRIGTLTPTGYDELSEQEILQITQKIKPILDAIRTHLVLKALRGEIDESTIKGTSKETKKRS
jgi:20S proteasome alpha/beta subunit